MEKFKGGSGIEKIRKLKSASPEEAEKDLAYYAGFFEGQAEGLPRAPEREKTSEEIEIIEEILRAMPHFIRTYEGSPLNLSHKYIHIVDPGQLNEKQKIAIGKRGGEEGWVIGGKTIAMLSRDTLLHEARIMVHELLHLHQFNSFKVKQGEKGFKIGRLTLVPQQLGMAIYNKNKQVQYFRGIDEAVIEELTMRFDRKYFSNFAPLKKAFEAREETEKRLGGHPYEEAGEVAEVKTEQKEDGLWETKLTPYAYPKERKILRAAIEKIFSKNRDEHGSREEVFALFAKAVLTGRLLELARIVEQSLGKGAFRKLAEETAIKASQVKK